jgi:hypothetical protein
MECNDKGPFILLTKKENFDLLKKTRFTPAANIDDALKLAYEKCGTRNPKVTIMPQGANTFPILRKR